MTGKKCWGTSHVPRLNTASVPRSLQTYSCSSTWWMRYNFRVLWEERQGNSRVIEIIPRKYGRNKWQNEKYCRKTRSHATEPQVSRGDSAESCSIHHWRHQFECDIHLWCLQIGNGGFVSLDQLCVHLEELQMSDDRNSRSAASWEAGSDLRTEQTACPAPGRGRDFQRFHMSWMRFEFDLAARVTMWGVKSSKGLCTRGCWHGCFVTSIHAERYILFQGETRLPREGCEWKVCFYFWDNLLRAFPKNRSFKLRNVLFLGVVAFSVPSTNWSSMSFWIL